MAKIKEVSSYNGTSWDTPIPIGANDANIDITSSTENPTDTTATSAGLVDSNVTVVSGDTDASAWTKFNRFRKRVQNAFGNFAGVTLRTTYNTSNTSTSVYTTGVINNYMSNVIGYTGTTTPSAGTMAAQLSSLNGITPFDTTPTDGSTKGVTSNGVFDFFRNAKVLNNGEDLDALYGDGATGLYYISNNVVNAPFNYCGLLVIGSGTSTGWQLVLQYYGAIAFRDHIGNPAKWRKWTYIPQDTYPRIYGEYNANVNPSNSRLYANITNNVAFISGYFRLASEYTGYSLNIGNISLNRKIACESTEGFFTSAIGAQGGLTRIKIDNECNIIIEKNTPANEWFSFTIAIPLRDKFM